MRRRGLLVAADLAMIAFASVLALLLRSNFEVPESLIQGFTYYLAFTLGVALFVLPGFGLDRVIWRFTSLADCMKVLAASCAIVLGAVSIGFLYNRLDSVTRATPILQCILIVAMLIGARALARVRHLARSRPAQLVSATAGAAESTVLVVGLSRLTDAYLHAVGEFGGGRTRVAGLLGRSDRHVGMSAANLTVLGTPEQVEEVLRDLEVHGVFVDRIVVATAFESLSLQAQEALLGIEEKSTIELEFVAELLRLDRSDRRKPRIGAATPLKPPAGGGVEFAVEPVAEEARQRHGYWKAKRVLDAVVATALIVLLAPLYVLVALLVAIDIGLPVMFWQQRPGLGGRPFKLVKFRTMASAHNASGRRRSDKERLSRIGRWLRRTRLDELPQLFNIAAGHMSFIGPRPLLPVDQSASYAARLLVRPGLTGWAQVTGGREVSASDKAALDVWYVRRASLRLDFEILARTVPMIVVGERLRQSAIDTAWRDLKAAGICRMRSTLTDMRDASASAAVTTIGNGRRVA